MKVDALRLAGVHEVGVLARQPYPGWIASAPESLATRMISGMLRIGWDRTSPSPMR
jgi:hypothetical protein